MNSDEPSAGMPVYRIADWAKIYENNRTRELKSMDWVPVPNQLDGDGYTELLDHRNGAAHYAAWMAILLIASRCSLRGILIRDNKYPHNFASLTRLSRIPEKVFREAIPRLVSIGWLIEDPPIENTTTYAQNVGSIPHPAAGIPQDDAGECLRARVEGNGREGKGREEEGTNRTAPHPPPPDGPNMSGPFEDFCRSFTGAIPDDTYRTFAKLIANPEELADIGSNTAAWMKVKKYSDGFYDAKQFLKSGVWRHPPRQEIVAGGKKGKTLLERMVENGRDHK